MRKAPRLDLLWPPAARAAAALPARLYANNDNFWQDLCDVLLDPEPDRHAAETARRWMRDQVEQDLMARLRECPHGHLTAWAGRLAPEMAWKLPCSVGPPPPRYHRRIAAILLPRKLEQLERQLARLAFEWRIGPVSRPPGSSPPPPPPAS